MAAQAPVRVPVRIDTPEDLRDLMQTDWTVSDEQWPAVSAPLEPCVVIAGAGSGKTTLMAARVVYLVATGQVTPDQVLGLTFTTKAAFELASDIRKRLTKAGLLADVVGDEERLEPTVATYNAFAASLLTEQGLRIGHEPDTRVMADASRYQLAARAVARHRAPVVRLTESPAHVLSNLLGLEGAMSEHLVSVEDVLAFDAAERAAFAAALEGSRAKKDIEATLGKIEERAELLELVRAYRRLKHQLGLMDFSDQIALAARLAEQHPDVGREERRKFRIVLLDEYQDTSVAQARMLGALFSGPAPDEGRGHAVTAVGDPNQAIYGWRGASVSNILGVGSTFPRADGSPDIPTYHLTISRRCDARILDVANALATPLYDDLDQVARLQPAPTAGEGVVHASLHPTAEHELQWLAEQVLAAEGRIAALPPDPEEPGTWRRIGVLTRDNATAAATFDALTARGIPVEIVGLSGLLRLPEVAEVVATLTLLTDLTANADLLTLLTGPRWAIGPRDLALLGRRARELSHQGRVINPAGMPLTEELQRAVTGADPTEVLALCDALEDPGDLPYSSAARERFSLLSDELRMLRRQVGEPLLELVRLIIETCGIDVELASSVSRAASARRDNLDLFVKAVADFQAIDGDMSLPALLAYLAAEDEYGAGLDIATPTEADSVKLLTVHRAKGLEWDDVFLVGVAENKFPTDRSRSLWTTVSWVLPAPLRGDRHDVPQLRGHTKDDLTAYRAAVKAHEAVEELRLGYVAVTRARHHLTVSSHWREHRGKPIGPSRYQQVVVDCLESWGAEPEPWAPEPDDDARALLTSGPAAEPWPVTEQTAEALRRIDGAELVAEARRELGPGAVPSVPDDLVLASRVAEWDDALERLLAEARRDRSTDVAVPLPTSLSATALARLREDPDGFARDLARPMPRQPSSAARFGTRFHAWVEARFGQQDLFDYGDLPGRADAGIEDEADLTELIATFESGPFATRAPYAVEPSFALVLGGQVVRGRIDAVYADGEDGYLVVDWKTNRAPTAEPLQLAIYRQAWAELAGIPAERVRAVFYYVRTGQIVEPPDLLDRQALEAIVAG